MQWNQVGKVGKVGILAAMVLIAASAQAQSAEQTQARNLAASCSGCHGTHGVAETGNESLAGAKQEEMLKKLMDFKTGKKPATVMHQLSKGYSDEQLATLATYFSNLKK